MFEVEERGSHHFVTSWDPPSEPNGVLMGYTLGYRRGEYELMNTLSFQYFRKKIHQLKNVGY